MSISPAAGRFGRLICVLLTTACLLRFQPSLAAEQALAGHACCAASEAVAEPESPPTQPAAASLQPWLDSLWAPTARKVYRGEELHDLVFPLGGIGAGSIGLAGTGELVEWQIHNQVNSRCLLPGGFFALRAQAAGRRPAARALQRKPAAGLPGVSEVEFVGEYPIAEVSYRDPALPVEIRLEACSPFIPLKAKDSALPAILFSFTVRNPGLKKTAVFLAASLQNAVGYDGFSQIEGVENRGYGGNLNQAFRSPGLTGLFMSSRAVPAAARGFGSLCLAVLRDRASVLPQWDDEAAFREAFSGDGLFRARAAPSPTPPGRTCNGALAVAFSLRPGESKTVAFLLAWHFPSRFYQSYPGAAQYRVGNMYSNWFADARAVAEYVGADRERLLGQTRLFRDTLYDSTLPYWLLDCVSSQISTLRSQTCLWLEDGFFGGYEGAACCPMNCTHVWNYEQTLAHLFPELERRMRENDLTLQQDPSGFIHHRTTLPLTLPRRSGPFVDGQLGTILKTYREHLRSPDASWLERFWPKIQLAMEFAIETWDPDGDGVLSGLQWNTYDSALVGPNTFIGSLWLAALRAAEEMARLRGDEQAAARYRALFEKGRAAMEARLWNGEYYVHEGRVPTAREVADDPTTAAVLKDTPLLGLSSNRPYGAGCHSDQLLGQWWANLLGLGHLFPPEHVETALASIVKYNWRPDFTEFKHEQRVFASGNDKGLLNCTWPRGGRPKDPIGYCDEAWTGVEYEVASNLIWEGMIEPGYQIIKSARERYNGIPRPPFKRNPWSEIECGEHYARAMSSWAILLAAQGFSYDGPAGRLGFSPRTTPEEFRSFFSTAAGWGSFSQKRRPGEQRNSLQVRSGEVGISELALSFPSGAGCREVTLRLEGEPVVAAPAIEGNTLRIRFPQRLTLRAGETLSVSVAFL